jgi:hypothetical protein
MREIVSSKVERWLVAMAASLSLTACADLSDAELRGGDQEEAGLEEKGAEAVVEQVARGAFDVLALVFPAARLGNNAINLGKALAGRDASLSESAIAKIAEVIKQSEVNEVQWRSDSTKGQLTSAERTYVRPDCTLNNTCSQATLTDVRSAALNLHDKASAAFYDATAATHVGFKQFQLLPVILHSGSVGLYALHELRLVDQQRGRSAADLKAMDANIKAAAKEFLVELDQIEDLYAKYVRETFFPGQVTSYHNGKSVGAYFKSPYDYASNKSENYWWESTEVSSFSQRESMEQVMYKAVDAERENQIQRYANEHRNQIFGASFQAVRKRLRELTDQYWNPVFSWSSGGRPAGKYCTQIKEPGMPAQYGWDNNYFCATRDVGMRWSYNKPLARMDCINVRKEQSGYWDDNYLCLPKGSPWRAGLSWGWTAPHPEAINRLDIHCFTWSESNDPSWKSGRLCVKRL